MFTIFYSLFLFFLNWFYLYGINNDTWQILYLFNMKKVLPYPHSDCRFSELLKIWLWWYCLFYYGLDPCSSYHILSRVIKAAWHKDRRQIIPQIIALGLLWRLSNPLITLNLIPLYNIIDNDTLQILHLVNMKMTLTYHWAIEDFVENLVLCHWIDFGLDPCPSITFLEFLINLGNMNQV